MDKKVTVETIRKTQITLTTDQIEDIIAKSLCLPDSTRVEFDWLIGSWVTLEVRTFEHTTEEMALEETR